MNERQKSRLRTKIIGWAICLLIIGTAAFLLWRKLDSGRPWQSLLLVAVAAFFGWRLYGRVRTSGQR